MSVPFFHVKCLEQIKEQFDSELKCEVKFEKPKVVETLNQEFEVFYITVNIVYSSIYILQSYG